LMQLMEVAFETLVEAGFNPEMAFLECCYEVKTITDLWMKYGPLGLTQKISPTAFYGGLTRGQRIIDARAKEEIKKIYQEIRNGEFAREWKKEVETGERQLKLERERVKSSALETVFQTLSSNISI
jgi:ketol-acid reductoisomerase